MVILRMVAGLNFCCLCCPHIWFGLGGDGFLGSSKKKLQEVVTQKF